MTKYLLPLCAALFLFPAVASAAPASPDRNDEGAMVVEGEGDAREVIFDRPESVDGETATATGTHVAGHRTHVQGSLIMIRTSFIPELVTLSLDI